jgi:hypothetical protein
LKRVNEDRRTTGTPHRARDASCWSQPLTPQRETGSRSSPFRLGTPRRTARDVIRKFSVLAATIQRSVFKTVLTSTETRSAGWETRSSRTPELNTQTRRHSSCRAKSFSPTGVARQERSNTETVNLQESETLSSCSPSVGAGRGQAVTTKHPREHGYLLGSASGTVSRSVDEYRFPVDVGSPGRLERKPSCPLRHSLSLSAG